MNQIIYTSNSNLEGIEINDFYLNRKSNFKKYLLKMFFYILVFIAVSLTIYYIYFRYDLYQSEKISQKLLKNFEITSIYSNNQDYTVNPVNREIFYDDSMELSSFVIGIIEIKKIDIVYPILSEINKNFLKISPCKFYGPMPNEVGNLCIAAHNYKNDSFFSNLSTLKNGDIVTIYDTSGTFIDYVIYSIYTSSYADTECMNQNTNNNRIITLVTCDSQDNKYRTIVKAKEI